MIRPKVGEDVIDIQRGTGAIGSAIDKLRLDPASYAYQKFKTSGNPYLNDEYWTEAAKRGETNALIDLLAKNTEKSEQPGEAIKNVYYDKLMRDYSQFADYDEYMLSLSIPYLDNTNKIERLTDNGIKIGDYTDREWAIAVMEESFKRHDAEVLEEQKKNMAWWKKALAAVGSAVSSVIGGASKGVQFLWNVGEGLINMIANFSNDDDWGDRFLYAFQDDDDNEPFAVIADRFKAISYDLMHDYTSGVNAVAAYEAGYRDTELSEILGAYGLIGPEIGYGASYGNWGKMWSGLWESIGQMLPSMLLSGGVSSALGKMGISAVAPKLSAAATKLAGTGTFYVGIFSGNISEALDYASMNGISYKDLNSGNVIGSAALKAVGQWGVEVALGRLIGFGTSARLRGQVNAAKMGAVTVGAKGGKAFISWAKRALEDAGREGLEEVLQDMSDSFINFMYGESGSEPNLREFYKGQAQETFTIENLIQSFFLGGLTSIIIGSFNTLTHIPQSKRALGTDADGKAYRLGVFQTMNFNEALKTMNEWNDIINDPKANKDAKQLAALKMSLTMNSLGEVMRSFGETNAYKANQALMAYAQSENKKEKIKAMSPHYAQDLFDTFAKEYTWAELQRDNLKKTTLKEKIVGALDKVKNKLQKKNVTKIDNIITPDTKIQKANEIDEDVTSEIMSPEVSENAKRILASTKAEAVVAVDGNVVTKSGDILIVGSELLESMDNAKILSAEAYDQVTEEVRLKLSEAQRKMILKEYNKIVGVEGNIEDAITALLFDKQFYTKILLLSGERGYQADAIQMLATIDGLVKAKAASNLRAGTIDMNAYSTLMQKVYNNMRDGIVTYATQFANLDLGSISNAVLPIEIKNQIRKNANVIFTNDANTGIKNAKSGTIVASDVERFNFYIEKFQSYIDGETYRALRNKVKSANLNDRLDAWGSLITLARLYGNKIDNVNLGKLTYLPAPRESLSELESGYVAILEDNFGDTLENLANDISNISKMSPEVKELLRNKDMNNRADRHYIVAEALFQISNHTMTIDEEFRPLRVISKADFLIDRYLGKDGTTNLFKDLLKNKIKTVADLVRDKTNIPKVILDTKINYVNGNIRGMRSENSDSIVIGNLANVDTLMHELTHVTQEIIYKNIKDANVIRGGSDLLIKTMEYDEAKRLNQYLAKNFPITYAIFRDKTQHSSFVDVAYHLLQGELEANVSLDTYLPSMGFTYTNDYKTLVSPDKKETFRLGTGVIKAKIETPAMLTKKTTAKSIISEDAILTESDKSKLDILANSITSKDKSNAIKEVNENTLYKGMNVRSISDFDPTKGNKSRITEKGSWFSLNQEVSKTYYNTRLGEATLYTAKGNISNPFVVDAKGQYFSNIDGLTGDQIASYAKENGYDSVIIKNVLDIGPNILNADRKLAVKPSTDVVIFDNNLLTDIKEIKIDKSGKIISEERVIKPKETKETKEARYINNKVAAQSNLKYFIRKGRPLEPDPDVRDFVISTTKDFNKLPIFLKNKIKNGTLNKFDILGYVATANYMNDYTFKQIASIIYKNEELAKITYEDMRELARRIEQLATLAYLSTDPYVKMTPEEMLDYNEEVMDRITNDSEFKKLYDKKNKRATTTTIRGTEVEAYADEDQLNPVFFRHYDGTLASLRSINNIGKKITAKQTIGAEVEITQAVESGDSESDIWNWVLRKRKSDVTYEYDDATKTPAITHDNAAETLDTLDRQEKINVIEDYISETISKRLGELPIDQRKQFAAVAMKKLETEINKLDSLSDDAINKRYLIAAENMSTNKSKINDVTEEVPLEEQPRATKNIKDHLRGVGATITERIAGLKSRYNSLPAEVKQYIDPKTYKLTADYRSLSDAELEILLTAFKAANKELTQRIRSITTAEKTTAQLRQRIEKMSQKLERAKTEVKPDSKKTLREKVQVEYKTKIKEQTFEFVTPVEANDQVKQLLDTNWNKKRMSKVKGLTNNVEYDVANGKQFYAENANILMSGDTAQMEDTLRWFLNAKMNNVTDPEYRKFQAIRLYTFLFAYQQAKATGLYPDLNPNLKTQIENAIRNEKSTAGTLLSISLDSLESMKAAEMVIDGITLPADIKGRLFDAIESNDIAFITKTQQEIMKYVAERKTAKKDIARKIVSVRSMAMLSSPLTWLRNKVSNFMLKRINKLSSAIGNKLWSKDSRGQLKLNKQITPEIQNYIAKNFIDNKLFDNLVSHLSKYNPSDISEWYKDATGKPTKQAIMAQMVIKSLYNQYYNENMFKSKFMNSVHQKLMQAMSDDSYVREATLRYFGKILAEKGYDLKKIQEDAAKNNSDAVTDSIMNDFATAVGLGLGDYMHSNNFFNKIETSIANSSDLGWFAYKMLLPYASASWNWFKEAIKLSPIGLGKAIVDTVRFEKRVAKLEADWQAGKSQISPELAQYMVRRDLGKGVIGTILWGLGTLLAGLGWIKLEDDDYGTPKLRIGNLAIDISSIFGSSSLLAGAALITGLTDNGITWDGFLDGLNRMADVTIDGFPLMQIVEMDMYSDGTWDIGMNQLESIALSFIPNIVSWIAGATYPGKVKKNKFYEKAAAKIPFLGNTLYQKVDPYTGESKSWWEAFNRFVPYISIIRASENELKTEKLGLNKKELRGKYTINNEAFTVTGKDLVALNEAYGKWNAIDLEKFYKNQMQVKIKVNNEYKTLTYNQMTDEQRRTAVNTIMSNNAEIAKIQAWTSQGNKYYASAELYKKLIERKITTNVYRGTKGFVKK
jgi:hypothetical protein